MIASAVNDLPASFEQLAATQSNVGRMRAAGVRVSIGMIDDNDTRNLFAERQYAGNLVALRNVPGATGVSWGEALAMITSRPAEAIGMGGEIGSLRPGPPRRRGDLVGRSARRLERRRNGLYRRRPRSRSTTTRPGCATATAICRAATCPKAIGIDPASRPFPVVAGVRRLAFPAVPSASRAARRGASASGPFQGLYSLVALLTFGAMIYFYRDHRPRAGLVGRRRRAVGRRAAC